MPTTFLSAVGQNYAKLFKAGDAPKMRQGHAFCECYVSCSLKNDTAVKSWILVDPTADELLTTYQSNNDISLHYSLGGEHNFIPFFRDVDILTKTNSCEWNKKMDEFLSKQKK